MKFSTGLLSESEPLRELVLYPSCGTEPVLDNIDFVYWRFVPFCIGLDHPKAPGSNTVRIYSGGISLLTLLHTEQSFQSEHEM